MRERDPLYWLDTFGQDVRFAFRLMGRNSALSKVKPVTLTAIPTVRVTIIVARAEPETVVNVFHRHATPSYVAVLSEAAWWGRFGSDANIVDRMIYVNRLPFTVVGVAPSQAFSGFAGDSELWIPYNLLSQVRPEADFSADQRAQWLVIYGAVAGCLALLLALTGVYAVVSFAVSQRVREIGIRTALGAQRRDVIALVLRSGLAPIVGGVIGGVGLAIAVSAVMRSVLVGVNPRDPGTLAIVLYCCWRPLSGPS